VQDLLQREAADVYRKLVLEGGHFYVCGDCTMAEHVYQRLKKIIQDHGSMTENQVERYMLKLRVSKMAYDFQNDLVQTTRRCDKNRTICVKLG